MTHPIGIIGLGMIGEKMLEEFLAHPAFKVAASWDLSPQICEEVHRKFPHAPLAQNAEEIIEDPKIAMVYIATPPVTHVDYGLRVIEQGKALFMEKPLSIDLAASQRLVQGAQDHAAKTAMNFGYGAGPIVTALERALASNEIGKIKSIEIRFEFPSWPLPNQLSAASWIKSRHTGGMVREMFSHHVYLIHRLFGLLSVSSAEVHYPAGKDAAEDFILASLTVGEIQVRFMGGIGSPQTPRSSDFTLNGEHASLRINEANQLLITRGGAWVDHPLDSARTSMQARLDQLANLLEGKPCTLPTLQDGFAVQKVIENLLATQ